MSTTDYKKEWFSKSQVDYFTAFINLWLSCNSWYNFHYSLGNDRNHVNKVKSDITLSNKLYKEFEKIVKGTATKEQKSFYNNIELLHFSLNRQIITPKNHLRPLSLETALVDYAQKSSLTGYENLLIKNAKTTTGKLKATVSGYDIGDIVIIDDLQKVFAGIFEIIYQIRCELVHGHLEPTDENNEVVKYCYLILFDLMKPFCS